MLHPNEPRLTFETPAGVVLPSKEFLLAESQANRQSDPAIRRAMLSALAAQVARQAEELSHA